MDEATVRRNLAELREELARFDDERNVVISLIRSYEAWLRIRGKDVSQPLPLPLSTVTVAQPEAEANRDGEGPAVSFRGAVVQVLRDAHGEPLHAKEILGRVEALGARTTAKNKLSVVSLAIRGLTDKHPIEKAGPRMWRWAGGTLPDDGE